MAFELLDGTQGNGILIEENALYEAWHVRLNETVTCANGVKLDAVPMIDTPRLRKPALRVASARSTGFRWTCPHCGEENESDYGMYASQTQQCECGKQSVLVLTDPDNRIMITGNEYPEQD